MDYHFKIRCVFETSKLDIEGLTCISRVRFQTTFSNDKVFEMHVITTFCCYHFELKIVNIYLPISFNVCFGYSKDNIRFG